VQPSSAEVAGSPLTGPAFAANKGNHSSTENNKKGKEFRKNKECHKPCDGLSINLSRPRNARWQSVNQRLTKRSQAQRLFHTKKN